tara:strand:+ start:1346 stop:1852 length:507 start_codon:yes stop_codon:yes gene_type:complete
VLLVALAVLWLGAGVYWLRNRIASPSMASGQFSERLRFRRSTRAVVVPLRGSQSALGYSHQPGHSLVEPPLDMRQKGINPMEITSEQARIRRRKVLLSLVGLVAFTLLLAIVAGGSFIALQLFSDTLLFGYVLALVHYQRLVEQAKQNYYESYDAPSLSYAATGTESL